METSLFAPRRTQGWRRLPQRFAGKFRQQPLWLFVLLAVAGVWAQDRPLALQPQPAKTAVLGGPYSQQLTATGGVPSYNWRIADGSGPLPPGLMLDPKVGVISGVPTTAGSFSFKVAVTDSAGPAASDAVSFTIEVPSALTLDWKQPPAASKVGITGSVVVSNQTGESVDLTVIIVAVNEVGKAFALAEQHFPLTAGSDSPSISFGKGSVLSFGKYVIHADAVGEVASANQIYRVRKESAEPFVIKQQ